MGVAYAFRAAWEESQLKGAGGFLAFASLKTIPALPPAKASHEWHGRDAESLTALFSTA